MKAIAARCLPIPESIDLFFLDQEYPATETPALDAVFEVHSGVEIFSTLSRVPLGGRVRDSETALPRREARIASMASNDAPRRRPRRSTTKGKPWRPRPRRLMMR